MYLSLQQSLPAVPGEEEPELPDVPTEEPAGKLSYTLHCARSIL